MYVRDAKNREEVWLLDRIEELGLDQSAFRSRDYVVAIDETTGEKAGFGRIRVHRTDEKDVCEMTSVGVVESWRGQGVGAHVIERLVEHARDDGFEELYALIGEPEYLSQFGFEPIAASALPKPLDDRLERKRERVDPDVVAMELDLESFEMPPRLRERFKQASPREDEAESEPEEKPEDFGIDPETATYKYDTRGK